MHDCITIVIESVGDVSDSAHNPRAPDIVAAFTGLAQNIGALIERDALVASAIPWLKARKRDEVLLAHGAECPLRVSDAIIDLSVTVIRTGGHRNLLIMRRAQ